jgi:hypothetical protein
VNWYRHCLFRLEKALIVDEDRRYPVTAEVFEIKVAFDFYYDTILKGATSKSKMVVQPEPPEYEPYPHRQPSLLPHLVLLSLLDLRHRVQVRPIRRNRIE